MANKREPKKAREGYVFTDGNGFFADVLWVAIGTSPDEFYEITREEYEELKKVGEEDVLYI